MHHLAQQPTKHDEKYIEKYIVNNETCTYSLSYSKAAVVWLSKLFCHMLSKYAK